MLTASLKSLAAALPFAVLALASPAARAEELGRAVIGGREIIIEKDGVWRYAEPAPVAENRADCAGETIKSRKIKLSLCVDPSVWRRSIVSGDLEALFATRDEKIYFGLISELGRYDRELFLTQVVDNSQRASGMFEVKLRSRSTVAFGGRSFERLAYPGKIDGIDIEYVNYVMLAPTEAFQIIFWSLSKDAGEIDAKAVAVMRGLRYEGP